MYLKKVSAKTKRHARAVKRYNETMTLLDLHKKLVMRWEPETQSVLFYEKLISNETLLVQKKLVTICDHKCICKNEDLYPHCYKKCQIKWQGMLNYLTKEEYRCSHYCGQETCSVGTWLIIDIKPQLA